MIDEIEQAIKAHRNWSLRLRKAIETAAFDLSAAETSDDHVCTFGKWLYSDSILPAARSRFLFLHVQVQHATFHRYASEVVLAALVGDRDKALALMDKNSGYELASTMLINGLRAWQSDCMQLNLH